MKLIIILLVTALSLQASCDGAIAGIGGDCYRVRPFVPSVILKVDGLADSFKHQEKNTKNGNLNEFNYRYGGYAEADVLVGHGLLLGNATFLGGSFEYARGNSDFLTQGTKGTYFSVIADESIKHIDEKFSLYYYDYYGDYYTREFLRYGLKYKRESRIYNSKYKTIDMMPMLSLSYSLQGSIYTNLWAGVFLELDSIAYAGKVKAVHDGGREVYRRKYNLDATSKFSLIYILNIYTSFEVGYTYGYSQYSRTKTINNLYLDKVMQNTTRINAGVTFHVY